MTEEQTLQALKDCKYTHPAESWCEGRLHCPYYDRFETCLARLHRDAVKLMKRQQRKTTKDGRRDHDQGTD